MREIVIRNHGSDRNYKLKLRYGITEDDFERMLAQQGGLCAICRAVPGTFVDHSHATGQVRGILCFNCNNGLGHFQDCLASLELAALYLDGVDYRPDFVILPEQRTRSQAPTRRYHLSQRYRIGDDEVERMVEEQLGLCAVCWSAEPEHVDHCHDTGAVRKALCLPCNTGIGQFRDDPAVVWRALAYLEPVVVEEALPVEELVALASAEDALWYAYLDEASMV
ncbi:endonuclease VII domain-containing protein [Nonomuraea sp. NPDC050556]|uniref:endonuclease VII domain-containing protein n=1 Tax=Nonomuraea sp. NPDC050556 TaxID=3364369 RepID=UPI0037AC9793